MDTKRIAVLVGSVVVMGAVFFALKGMNQPVQQEVRAPEVKTIVKEVDYSRVMTVTEAMDKGQRIGPDDLTFMDWPTDAITPAMIIEDTEADTPTTEAYLNAIVRDPVFPGEPLTPSKFIRAGEAGIMAALLKPGMRAVTIRISVDSAAGGFIQPGDKVDIIQNKTVQIDDASTSNETLFIAETVFEDVLVLAIDQQFSSNGGAAAIGSTATLELNTEDALRLLEVQREGELALFLRGFSGSNANAPSRATNESEEYIPPRPLTIYRQGAVEAVAVQTR